MSAIQKVLQEHNVSNARVSLDLFPSESSEAMQENIEIFLEQHAAPAPPPASTSLATASAITLPGGVVVEEVDSEPLSSLGQPELHRSQPAEPLAAPPSKPDSIPRPRGFRSSTPQDTAAAQLPSAHSAEKPMKPVPPTIAASSATPARRSSKEEISAADTTTAPLTAARPSTGELKKALASAQAGEPIDRDHLTFPPELLALVGLGGAGGGNDKLNGSLQAEKDRQERIRVLKSWVGKSTLLDDKKAREVESKTPPKQFLGERIGMSYAIPLKNRATGDATDLPELAALAPRPPSARAASSTTPNAQERLPPASSKPLAQLLKEQREAEKRNKKGLEEHEKIMKAAREYIDEVENDPERKNLVEFMKNPLTKSAAKNGPSTPNATSPTLPPPTSSTTPPPSQPATGIKLKRVTLPEDPTAVQALIDQLRQTPEGRQALSSSNINYMSLCDDQKRGYCKNTLKKEEYKRLLDAAIKYNESLGIKEGKP